MFCHLKDFLSFFVILAIDCICDRLCWFLITFRYIGFLDATQKCFTCLHARRNCSRKSSPDEVMSTVVSMPVKQEFAIEMEISMASTKDCWFSRHNEHDQHQFLRIWLLLSLNESRRMCSSFLCQFHLVYPLMGHLGPQTWGLKCWPSDEFLKSSSSRYTGRGT